ncbi:MAG: hypothetical protein AB8C84_05375 [Oligoflexales bacterium]
MELAGLKNILDLIHKNPAQTMLRERFLVLLFELEDEEKLVWIKALAETLRPVDPKESLKLAYMIYQHSPDRLQLDFLADCLETLGRKEVAHEVRSHIKHVDVQLSEGEDTVAHQDVAQLYFEPQKEQEAFKIEQSEKRQKTEQLQKSQESFLEEEVLPKSKFILESFSSARSFSEGQNDKTELLKGSDAENEISDENHDPLGLLQDVKDFEPPKNSLSEELAEMQLSPMSVEHAFEKSIYDGIEHIAKAEVDVGQKQRQEHADGNVLVSEGVFANGGSFHEELATQALSEDSHAPEKDFAEELVLSSDRVEDSFVSEVPASDVVMTSSSFVDEDFSQDQLSLEKVQIDIFDPFVVKFHDTLEFQGAMQSLLVGYDTRLFEKNRNGLSESSADEWSDVFYQDLLEYVQQDDESVDCLVFALFDHHRSLSLAKLLDESGLWGVDASYFGLYLDSLLAAGAARRALVMIQYKTNAESSDEWIVVCQRRLPEVWDQLGVRGPSDLDKLPREKFIEIVQQRQRPTWKGVLSF